MKVFLIVYALTTNGEVKEISKLEMSSRWACMQVKDQLPNRAFNTEGVFEYAYSCEER